MGALAWFAYNVGALFLTYPPPWPDEALFADVSANLLRHGRLATDLYAEFFPAMTQHYYLTPPLYHVLITGWFAVFGIGISSLRAFSLLAGIGVLAATYGVVRRMGLPRAFALIPCALLALDVVFLRASLLGRMDMLALLFILSTIWLVLGGIPGRNNTDARRLRPRSRALLVGISSGLAVLTHPIGAVAVPIAIGWGVGTVIGGASSGAGSRGVQTGVFRSVRHIFLPMLVSLALVLLPWGLYAARDPHAFMEQLGGQFLRKTSRDWWAASLPLAARQWGIARPLVLAFWVAGTVGPALSALRGARGWVLVLAQLLIAFVILPSSEIWYPIYATPLAYVGLGCAMADLMTPLRWRQGVAIAFAALAVCFALANVARISVIRGPHSPFHGADPGYSDWCRQLAARLPERSTVLLDLLPTPYFGIPARDSLALRFSPPAGFNLPPTRLHAALERMDFIVAGRSLANREVRDFVIDHGDWVSEVGEPRGPGYYAAIIRVVP